MIDVGEDVENILLKLIQNADYDIESAERGIVFLDEIGKISRKSENPSITRDVSGEGVQQGLLKILEGTIARVPPQGGRKHPQQQMMKIDTTNILFICSGSFEGLENIVEKRIGGNRKRCLGFGTTFSDEEKEREITLHDVQPEDLVKFGLLPEFVGRLPIICATNPLTEQALIKILTEPENSLVRQYELMFDLDGVDLEFEDSALKRIAYLAFEKKTGARGLRGILESIMLDIMFEIPSKEDIVKVIITEDTVNGGSPRIGKGVRKPKSIVKVKEADPLDDMEGIYNYGV